MRLKLGISGEQGSFSEEAAVFYSKKASLNPTFVYLTDMEGVLQAIQHKTIDQGIFPVVNRQGGLVKQAFQAMGKYLFLPIDEFWLPINQCLLALPGTSLKEITCIVSHPQGLAQCAIYIQNQSRPIECIEWCDTAKAASDLAQGRFPPLTAVIAPERCSDLYGLTVLARSIQDSNPNLTAFIVAQNREV